MGFITPMPHNSARAAITCAGILYMFLCQDAAADLHEVLRASNDSAQVTFA